MIAYLIINSLITCTVLAINTFMHIPYRVKFYLLMFSLVCWLVPFGLLTIELSQSAIDIIPLYNNTSTVEVGYSVPKSIISINWNLVILVGFILGLIRFVFDFVKTHTCVSSLKKSAKAYKKDSNIMLVKNINNAFISGYFNQVIFIDEKLLGTTSFEAAITHEKQHIKQNDQFWLLILHFIQRLFWFNPLVVWLSYKTRNSIELSCDERCKNILGKYKYQNQLAALILNYQEFKPNMLNNYIKSKNFNIERINKLNEENTMHKKQITQLVMLITATFILSIYSLLSIAAPASKANLEDHQTFLELEIVDQNNETTSKTMIVNNNEFTYFNYKNLNIGVLSKVFDKESGLIYNEFSVKNSKNEDLAHPAMTMGNREWGAFKIEDSSHNLNLEIKIKATSNSAKNKLEASVEKYIFEKEKPFWTKYNESVDNMGVEGC